jgi:GNAT superfamily N-acetyltransferase
MATAMISYTTHTNGVDWERLKADLIRDDFHNGRTTTQLRLSFENSAFVALGFDGPHCIANGRMLSDGVGNAMIVDVWTHSGYRRQGIATVIMQMLVSAVPGQHIYLQSDDAVGFYLKLGFNRQPEGLALISGHYLVNATNPAS